MTDEELITVAKIMLTADSWCSNCQVGLFNQLREAFPNRTKLIDSVWNDRESLECRLREAMNIWYDTYEGLEPQVWKI